MRWYQRLKKTYIVIILAFFYAPLLCVIALSFNSNQYPNVWAGFSLKWYSEMLNDRALMRALLNSLTVAFFSTVFSAIFGTAAAIGSSRLKGWKKSAFGGIIYLPIILPEVILGLALVMFFSLFNVHYGIVTIVLSHITFCMPYVYLMVSIRLRGIDSSVYEAAIDLGADASQVFTTIVLPLVAPGIATGSLLSIAMSLDDVVISYYVSGPTSGTLPIQLFSMMKLGITPKINALCTIIFTVIATAAFLAYNVSSRKKRGDKINETEIA